MYGLTSPDYGTLFYTSILAVWLWSLLLEFSTYDAQEENRENQEQIIGKVYEVTDHPRVYPQCAFGEIAKRLCEQPKKTWEDIKAEFNIPMKYQLRGWYSRKAKTIFPKIRQFLQEE